MLQIQFKAKVREGFVKIPNFFTKDHCVNSQNFRNSKRFGRWYNSDLFLNILHRMLKKELKVPLGQTVLLGDLPAGVWEVKEGFSHTLTLTLPESD